MDLLASMISVFADHGATLEDLYDLMLKNVRLHLASAPNGDDLMVALVAAAVVKVAEHRQVS